MSAWRTRLFTCHAIRPGVRQGAVGPAAIRVGADDILIANQRPEGISAANVLPGTIRSIEPLAGEALITVAAGDEFVVRLTSAAILRLGLRLNSPVFLIIKTRSFRVL